MSTQLSSSLAVFLLSLLPCTVSAQTSITVAAAADLSAAQPALSAVFSKTDPRISVRFVNGASAALAQQIGAGAPFDVFLSANVELVDKLHLNDAKTYAVGHVALLWKDGKSHPLSELKSPAIRFVALPNPKLAPYGVAAEDALRSMHLWAAVAPKIVYGENVRQALQLFDSGNADAVLTAASLVVDRAPQIVPSAVVQKAGIVPASGQAEAAKTFLDWLVSPPAQLVLAKFGFDPPGIAPRKR